MTIDVNGPWFCDEYGRTVLLRGVNLSGSSKIPSRPNGATHRSEGFFDHRNVSFVGRPFPLEEAPEHFCRLKAWGLTTLRFLVTWEAVEHSGPGIYDEEYLDYLEAIIRLAGEYGFRVVIDPHQDVWSRFSGGDGAPGWTFEAAGIDLRNIHQTAGAILHQFHGDPFPQMVWPTNGMRLAAATMFTLFFGGNDFAPLTRVDGEPIQEYLQRHYFAAFQQVARRLKNLPAVIGYEAMNEPTSGFIGIKDLTRPMLPVKFGATFSPLQSMLLGSGIPQEIEVWQRHLFGSRLVERQLMNPQRLRIWREGFDGVWRQNRVWDIDAHGNVRVLNPHHFYQVRGRTVNFSQDYMRPFLNRFAAAIRQIVPDALIFIETDPRLPPPIWGPDDARRIVYAPHWYDPAVLFLKTFTPWAGYDVHTGRIVLGSGRVRRSYIEQNARYKRYAAERLGNIPTFIGETGIAFDLNGRRAYRTGDFSAQVRAMDRTLNAMDSNLLSYAIWNYTPDNDNERGDQWNGEDLSIFSRDQQTDPADIHSGGRALAAIVRPYPRATAGEPLHLAFDLNRREFRFEFRHNPAARAPTEIFVPNYQYPNGYNVWITDGECEVKVEDQLLIYHHDSNRAIHRIKIMPNKA